MKRLLFVWLFVVEVLSSNSPIKIGNKMGAQRAHRGISRNSKPGQTRGFLRVVLGAVHKPLHLTIQRNAM